MSLAQDLPSEQGTVPLEMLLPETSMAFSGHTSLRLLRVWGVCDLDQISRSDLVGDPHKTHKKRSKGNNNLRRDSLSLSPSPSVSVVLVKSGPFRPLPEGSDGVLFPPRMEWF